MTLLELLEEMTSLRDTFQGSFSCVFNLMTKRVISPILKLHLAVLWSADVSSGGTINLFHGLLTTSLYVCSFIVNLSGEDSLRYLCVRAWWSFCNSIIGDFLVVLVLTFSITIRFKETWASFHVLLHLCVVEFHSSYWGYHCSSWSKTQISRTRSECLCHDQVANVDVKIVCCEGLQRNIWREIWLQNVYIVGALSNVCMADFQAARKQQSSWSVD